MPKVHLIIDIPSSPSLNLNVTLAHDGNLIQHNYSESSVSLAQRMMHLYEEIDMVMRRVRVAGKRS
jgi:hypothetical protein